MNARTKSEQSRLSVMFIDNFDSFVFNLVDEFEKRGCAVETWRNDIPASEALEKAMKLPLPRLVVLSPGPGRPDQSGCCVEMIRKAPGSLPIFGVCLGHQAIIEAFGGTVGRAGEIVHGKASLIDHTSEGLFLGLPSPLTVGRYHSLTGTTIPESLRVTARLKDLVMAVEHLSRKAAGVQFHPESILTPQGGLLIDNVMRWADSKERNI